MKVAVSLIALSAASIVAAHDGAGSVSHRHREYVKRREAVYGRQAVSAAPASVSGAAATTTSAAAQPAVTTPTVAGTVIPPLDQITSGERFFGDTQALPSRAVSNAVQGG